MGDDLKHLLSAYAYLFSGEHDLSGDKLLAHVDDLLGDLDHFREGLTHQAA